MNYHNKKFKPVSNSETGETSEETLFVYKQSGQILTSEYSGGKIIKGHLIGMVDENGNIDMRYHQINHNNELRTGKCLSIPEILADGTIRLHEKWEWTSGDFSKGESIIEEIKEPNFTISQSNLEDIPFIQKLYAAAIVYQNQKNGVPWGNIKEEAIVIEVQEKRQWKLIKDGQTACIWVSTFEDTDIWGADREPSLYLHRITTNPHFRGQQMVSKVIHWAKQYAIEQNKSYLRLDTAGLNPGLITLYVKNGFKFLGTTQLAYSENLPSHYHHAAICLFEMKLKEA